MGVSPRHPGSRPVPVTRGDLHKLARADAEHGMHAGLDEAGEMGVGTQAAIRHEHISGCSSGVPFVPLGKIVGQTGGDHQLQEQARAGMEQPQEVCHGQAAPRPLLRRRPEGLLEGRSIGHGAARAIDPTGAMPVPPPCL